MSQSRPTHRGYVIEFDDGRWVATHPDYGGVVDPRICWHMGAIVGIYEKINDLIELLSDEPEKGPEGPRASGVVVPLGEIDAAPEWDFETDDGDEQEILAQFRLDPSEINEPAPVITLDDCDEWSELPPVPVLVVGNGRSDFHKRLAEKMEARAKIDRK